MPGAIPVRGRLFCCQDGHLLPVLCWEAASIYLCLVEGGASVFDGINLHLVHQKGVIEERRELPGIGKQVLRTQGEACGREAE
jgi:hypothetical protein